MKKLNRILILFVLLLMAGAIALTSLDTESGGDMLANPVNWLVAVAAVFLLIAIVATFQALDAMKYLLARKEGRLSANEEEEDEDEDEDEESWLSGLMQKITDATPVEEEERVATEHEYDGIRELDNNLPPWWLAGFYLSILFAVIYLLRYHVFQTAPLQEEEFRIEMAEAEKQKEAYRAKAANLVDESNVEMVESEDRILNGKAIFMKNCAVCHQKDGGGSVGPNLTDAYWIHGNSIKEIFSVIKYGVSSQGMIPWQDQLSAAEMQDVASFVMTLKGTEPSDPKEPQGDFMGDEPAEENNETEAGEEAEPTGNSVKDSNNVP